jgi:hypothetical protein
LAKKATVLLEMSQYLRRVRWCARGRGGRPGIRRGGVNRWVSHDSEVRERLETDPEEGGVCLRVCGAPECSEV